MPPTSLGKARKQPRQARSKATVETILDATARILVRHGYAAANTNRIAETAGISVGSLYQYFPSKAALVIAVKRRHAHEMRAMLASAAESLAGAPLAEAVRTLISASMAAHLINPQLHRVLEEEVPRPDVLDHRAEIDADVRAIIKGLLFAHRQEILPVDLDLASVMLVRLVEAMIHAAVVDCSTDLPAELVEQELVVIVLRYLQGSASLA